MFTGFNWQQMVSAFIVLFAVIDIIGSIPIIINLKEKERCRYAMKATVISFVLLIGFFLCRRYDAETLPCRYRIVCSCQLRLFIFLMSLEMILDIEIFSKIRVLSKKLLWCRLSFLCWQVPELLLLCFLFGRNMPVLISL